MSSTNIMSSTTPMPTNTQVIGERKKKKKKEKKKKKKKKKPWAMKASYSAPDLLEKKPTTAT